MGSGASEARATAATTTGTVIFPKERNSATAAVTAGGAEARTTGARTTATDTVATDTTATTTETTATATGTAA